MRKTGFSISSLAKELEKSNSERLMWKNGFECNRRGYYAYAKMLLKKNKPLSNRALIKAPEQTQPAFRQPRVKLLCRARVLRLHP